MRCDYINAECDHLNTATMTKDVECMDCEHYNENGSRLSLGCLVPAAVIIIPIDKKERKTHSSLFSVDGM